MFLAIAGVSVVVGICVVAAVFWSAYIVRRKGPWRKGQNRNYAKKNLAVVDDLKGNIRVLNTDEALQSVKLNDSDSALQSVLDALPADANSTGMAASLQQDTRCSTRCKYRFIR